MIKALQGKKTVWGHGVCTQSKQVTKSLTEKGAVGTTSSAGSGGEVREEG